MKSFQPQKEEKEKQRTKTTISHQMVLILDRLVDLFT